MLEFEVFVFELVAIDRFTARALCFQQAIVSNLECACGPNIQVARQVF